MGWVLGSLAGLHQQDVLNDLEKVANRSSKTKTFLAKNAVKSIPGPADVEVPHGVEDGLRTPTRCLEGSEIFSNV